MAASKPTSWMSVQLHILTATQPGLGTLAGGQGCFPLDHGVLPRSLTPVISTGGIRSLTAFGVPVRTLRQSVLYPRRTITRGQPYSCFEENQISPSLIGLSPLSTGHPSVFQHATVRTFTPCYRSFILPMDRSLGFGSAPDNLNRAVHTRFRCGYPSYSAHHISSGYDTGRIR